MDLLRRIRWGNVARAAALLAAVALILAWPRLRADPPPLPPEPALAAGSGGAEEFGIETREQRRRGEREEAEFDLQPAEPRANRASPHRRRARRGAGRGEASGGEDARGGRRDGERRRRGGDGRSRVRRVPRSRVVVPVQPAAPMPVAPVPPAPSGAPSEFGFE